MPTARLPAGDSALVAAEATVVYQDMDAAPLGLLLVTFRPADEARTQATAQMR